MAKPKHKAGVRVVSRRRSHLEIRDKGVRVRGKSKRFSRYIPEKLPVAKASFRVVIFTYDRPRQLMRLLQDVLAFRQRHDVSVVVYDDASPNGYDEVRWLLQDHQWGYVRASKRHGKKTFWTWVSRAYGAQRNRKEEYFILLADDLRLCANFFSKALAVWGSVRDPKKISLCLLRDSGRSNASCWTGVSPTDCGTVQDIGWVDGAILCQRRYFEELNWSVPAVDTTRWDDDPNISTGVGQKVSLALHGRGWGMYGVKSSLLVHASGPSKMNPEARKQNPLRAVGFVDGDTIHEGLLLTDETWVSLASVPRRVRQLKKVVEALYDQCDRLNVYLNGHKQVPAFLKRPKIVVVRSQEQGNRGDAGKFFWVSETKGYYLTVDDDLAYPANYVQTLVRKIDQYQRKAIVGVHGVVLFKDLKDSYYNNRKVHRCLGGVPRDIPVHLLGTGVAGFHVSTIKVSSKTFRAPNMADVWLAIAAKKQKVPMVCVAHGDGWIKDLGDPDITKSIWGNAKKHDHVQARHLKNAGSWGRPLAVPRVAAANTGKRRKKKRP